MLLAGCQGNPEKMPGSQQPTNPISEEVSFTTGDGFLIKGTLYKANSTKSVLLLHMLGSDRNSYKTLGKRLQESGYNALAIDLRGHGQSTAKYGKQETLSSFTEQDFREMVLDAAASSEFLAERNKTMTAIVGASIGANTAINYAAREPGIKAVVLLSPGENYRGIGSIEAAQKIKMPVYIVASSEDAYSAGSSRKIASLLTGKNELNILKGRGHGTDMLDEGLEMQFIAWIGSNT